jgi:hypothetical protein
VSQLRLEQVSGILEDVGAYRSFVWLSGYRRAGVLERPAGFRSDYSDSNAHCQGVGEPTLEKPKGAAGMDTSETMCGCNGLGLGSIP